MRLTIELNSEDETDARRMVCLLHSEALLGLLADIQRECRQEIKYRDHEGRLAVRLAEEIRELVIEAGLPEGVE